MARPYHHAAGRAWQRCCTVAVMLREQFDQGLVLVSLHLCNRLAWTKGVLLRVRPRSLEGSCIPDRRRSGRRMGWPLWRRALLQAACLAQGTLFRVSAAVAATGPFPGTPQAATDAKQAKARSGHADRARRSAKYTGARPRDVAARSRRVPPRQWAAPWTDGAGWPGAARPIRSRSRSPSRNGPGWRSARAAITPPLFTGLPACTTRLPIYIVAR